MKRIFFVHSLLFFCLSLCAQSVSTQLSAAFDKFEKDTQLKSGIASLYVINAKSGAVIFEKNATMGLAPASTQKIITSASAYELLGKNFQYKTEFGFEGDVTGNTSKGHLYIKPSGDPTLGSWRYNTTKEDAVRNRWTTALKKSGIKGYGSIKIDNSGWDEEAIPDGWIWQDVGNYYGAGAFGLNWRENQFDVLLSSENEIGSTVKIGGTVPAGYNSLLTSKVTAAARGTGDNAYVYYPFGQQRGVVRGT
ncbi:MAG TPA: D-alanyl-D-alanine carboxypeptidase, partial [Chitinophagaceae bacterium]|nr:D-alanyl-D-alanine carboxypeptidase [Chitinophagaceae bacterium]